jgi:hypothetical protein
VIQRSVDLDNERKKLRPRRWNVVRFEIDGTCLERWFLKTLINIVVSRESADTWGLTGSALNEVPELLVQAAFGRTALQKPLGLYAAAMVGETVVYRDAVEVATLLRSADDALVGALFKFMGVRFLLYLYNADLPASLPLPAAATEWLHSDVLYHISRMNVKVNGKMSHYIQFLWNLT